MIADIVFLAALLVVGVIGYAKSFTGIVRGVLFACCLIATTALLTMPLTRLFELTGLGRVMANSFAENFAEKGGGMLLTVSGGKSELIAGLKQAGVPGILATPCAAIASSMLPVINGTVAEVLGQLLAKVILSGIAAIILFIFIAVLFSIIKKVLLRSHENDVFRKIDGVLGVIAMISVLLCVTWIALGIVQVNAPTEFGVKSITTLNKNYILRFMYLNNPLAGFSSGFFG